MGNTPKYVAAIGASAGGLEAIQAFFNYMPTHSELTFIIAQHLSPNFNSMMSELLTHNTSLPIIVAKNNLVLQSGTIYLIPATYEAQVENNRFKLIKLKRNFLSLPINTLLKSVGIAYGPFSIGIIFSGTGSDGSLGMTEIAKNKGLTLAQIPTEAKFTDMPVNAIATETIRCVVSVSEMPDLILEYIKQPADFKKQFKQTEFVSKAKYSELFHLLEQEYHINFALYKQGTVSRRIHRRMKLLNIDDLQKYLDYLKHDQHGLKTLYQDLLIGVTSFFRDPDAFDCLARDVIPLLFKKLKKITEDIRIWVSSCATGEEAYSVAILFKKYADEHNLPFSVKIFASDVSSDFIQKAKKGRYSYESAAGIPADLLSKYFVKSNDYYEIIPEIRQKILFTTHNLLRDPPFTKMDLVCCRNLLIYINAKEQKRITDLLGFSLNIGGFLFLGPSESLSNLSSDFTVKNQLWKIFHKTKRSHFPMMSVTRFTQSFAKEKNETSMHHTSSGALPSYVYNAILQDVVSAGFIIDKSYLILHSIGKARELILFPEGIPTLILPKIIIQELKGILIEALHKVENSLMPVMYNNIVIYQGLANQYNLNMTVYPICDLTHNISHYWIGLEPVDLDNSQRQKNTLLPMVTRDPRDDDVIISLESELSEARVLLQASLENTETVNEEMQSTNEELMASNEELQSANEELQSVNEELYTVNSERSNKIAELLQANTDIDNLIRSAEIYTMILNDQLEIRIFTPAISKIFNLVSHDIGRPLKNFRHQLKFDLFMTKVDEVLKEGVVYENEVKDNQDHWYFLKISPYYSAYNHSVTGVVISLTDINDAKLLQKNKDQIQEELRLTLKTGLIGVWHVNLEDYALVYDETIKKIYGLDSLSSMKQFKSFLTAIHPEDRKRVEKAFELAVSSLDNFEEKFRIRRPDKKIRYLSCSANVYQDQISNLKHVIGICWDMTEQYWLDERIIDAEHLNLGLDAITDGWWDWNLMSNQVYLSPLLKRTLGYDDHELPNSMESYEALIIPEDRRMVHLKMNKYLANNSTYPLVQKIRARHKTGSMVWLLIRRQGILNKQKKLIRLIGTITDITAVKKNEATLKKLAYRDSLTKLYNRAFFLDALSRAIERSKRNQSIFAVIYIDIDDFKRINDQWGHHVGDSLLYEFSNKLTNLSRTVDLIARVGGDEFVVLLEDIDTLEEIHTIGLRYVSAFSDALKVDKIEISISISVGAAFYPKDGVLEAELLKCADSRMYIAKKQGKNQCVLDSTP